MRGTRAVFYCGHENLLWGRASAYRWLGIKLHGKIGVEPMQAIRAQGV
jgi:hypothetical protein